MPTKSPLNCLGARVWGAADVFIGIYCHLFNPAAVTRTRTCCRGMPCPRALLLLPLFREERIGNMVAAGLDISRHALRILDQDRVGLIADMLLQPFDDLAEH